MSERWTKSDDPRDPCWLCCSVEYDDDDPMNDDLWVVSIPDADGEMVPCDRVYRHLHDECARAMEDYVGSDS